MRMKTLARGVLITLGVVVVLVAGAWLALRRADIPYDKLEARYASSASRYVVLPDGARVHYRDQGPRDAPVVVLVHGFSASLHAWEPWVERLSGRYRVVTLDLPGHGLTRAPKGYVGGTDAYVRTVEGLARHLQLPRFVLGGNSMGGGVAWNYALAHPERLDGLVLVDSAGWPQGEGANKALIFRLLANPVSRGLLKDLDSRPLVIQGLKAGYLDERLVTPALIDRYVDLSRGPGHRDILTAQQSGPRRTATEAGLAKIGVRTLVMHGREDRLIPFASGERFARAIPNAEIILYDRVGHAPMEQIPDRSAADLAAWLDRGRSPTASTE